MENTVIVSDLGSSHYLPGHSKPYDPRTSADAQESMKAKVIAIRKKLVEQVSEAATPRPQWSLRVRAASQSFRAEGEV